MSLKAGYTVAVETNLIHHRPFADEDALAISQFARSAEELFYCFPKATFPLNPELLIGEANRRQCPTVALLGGAVAGYVHFQEVRQRRFCAIGNLMVDPAHRRKGLAAYLIEAMASKAGREFGVRFVRASCFSHNSAAYQLYHKLGFRPADMVLRRAPDGEMWLLVHLHRRTGC